MSNDVGTDCVAMIRAMGLAEAYALFAAEFYARRPESSDAWLDHMKPFRDEVCKMPIEERVPLEAALFTLASLAGIQEEKAMRCVDCQERFDRASAVALTHGVLCPKCSSETIGKFQ